MTYPLLTLVFLALAGAVAAAVVLRRRAVRRVAGSRRPGPRPGSGRAAGLAAAALLLLTAVFDNVMIAVGLFTYAGEHVSGLRVGLAPVEDFAYPLAAVILLPALWSLLTPRPGSGRVR